MIDSNGLILPMKSIDLAGRVAAFNEFVGNINTVFAPGGGYPPDFIYEPLNRAGGNRANWLDEFNNLIAHINRVSIWMNDPFPAPQMSTYRNMDRNGFTQIFNSVVDLWWAIWNVSEKKNG